MNGRPPGPRDLARQLLSQHARDADASPMSRYETVRSAAAALSRSIGRNALDALLSRAVTLTVPDHPLTADLSRLLRKDGPGNEVASLANVHGGPTVGAALEALLVALLELLSRLIGDEMSARILTIPASSPREPHANKGRE